MGVPDSLRINCGTLREFFGRLVMSRFFNRSSAAINQLTMRCWRSSRPTACSRWASARATSSATWRRSSARASSPASTSHPTWSRSVGSASPRWCRRSVSSCAARAPRPSLTATTEFNRACTVNTIYFWPDPAVPLRELSRVLRAGGRLVIGFSPAAAMRRCRAADGARLHPLRAGRPALPARGRRLRRCRDGPGPRSPRGFPLRDREEGRRGRGLTTGTALGKEQPCNGSPASTPRTDRIACPWLIRRFIDPDAEIVFVPATRSSPSPSARAPLLRRAGRALHPSGRHVLVREPGRGVRHG